MKNWVIMPIMLIIVILGTGLSQPTYNGLLLKNSNVYKNIELQSIDILKDIVVVPESPFNETEAMMVLKRLDILPISILQNMKKKRIKVILFTGELTDNPSAAHLKGVAPRGYPSGIVWNDLPGVGGSKLILVKIGHSEQGKGHGSVNLEYHEIAHTIYHYTQNDSNKTDFTLAWEQEANILFPGQSYFLNYKEEYFAESFALFFLSDVTRMKLKEFAPVTYGLFSQLYNG
ncbi:anthrax toxin lethal factor-related metalloendopeptidase [Bacillus sp. FSL K6-3431]|uniref:anthrax toxin lethal factor-related metalloendopeptidase n=1 Tax=Bacillus sp. FSL K6-3431 TaxID=2921500 RepID=UPI0030FC4EB8